MTEFTAEDRYKYDILKACRNLHMDVNVICPFGGTPDWNERLADWLEWRLNTWTPSLKESCIAFDRSVFFLIVNTVAEYRNWKRRP